MNRRAFIQGLIGLASMPMLSKYINVFKPAAVRQGITQAADNTMQKGIEFYEAVIKRVMDEGTVTGEADRFRTYKHPDKPDISVELNVGTGDTAVYFDTDMGSRAGAEISTDIEIPRAGKELMENEEVYRMGGDNYYKDVDEEITGGVGSLEEWIKMKRGYAAGGRVGMWRGGVPKGLQAALRLIRSKFGDDAITTADKAPQPGKNIQEEIMDFNARNPDPKRQMTGDEYEEFLEEIGGGDRLEAYNFDGTVGDGERILREDRAYFNEMELEYKKGNLDPVAGDKSPARKRFLEKKFEDMEMSGDNRLMTIDEIEELSSFDLGTEMDNFVSTNKEIKRGVAEIMSDTSPAALEKSIEIDNLMLKYEGMDRRLAEQIATEINPRKKADIIAMVEQTFKMSERGMSGDDIIQTFKNTPRTKQANGGIIGLTNNPMTASSKAGVESLFERR